MVLGDPCETVVQHRPIGVMTHRLRNTALIPTGFYSTELLLPGERVMPVCVVFTMSCDCTQPLWAPRILTPELLIPVALFCLPAPPSLPKSLPP